LEIVVCLEKGYIINFKNWSLSFKGKKHLEARKWLERIATKKTNWAMSTFGVFTFLHFLMLRSFFFLA